MIISLCVDDLLLTATNTNSIAWMKSALSKRFDMKDLDRAWQSLGRRISRHTKTRTVAQSE